MENCGVTTLSEDQQANLSKLPCPWIEAMVLARKLNCFAEDFARRKVSASVPRNPDMADYIGCCSQRRRNWEIHFFTCMSRSQKPALNVCSFNTTLLVGITYDGWYSTAHQGPCCPLILLWDPMGQREAQIGGRWTAPTHTAICVSPWELRVGAQIPLLPISVSVFGHQWSLLSHWLFPM